MDPHAPEWHNLVIFRPEGSMNRSAAMPENETLEEAIRRNASGPKSAEVDGQKVEQHGLSDLIKADQYLASKKAVKSRTSGLKFAKMSHSGA